MVEGGTPWGLPRLQPERQGPDRGLGLVGAAHARRAGVDASTVGEVADCDPAAFTLATAPAQFAERGDASAGIDSAAGSLDALLELSASQEAAGPAGPPW